MDNLNLSGEEKQKVKEKTQEYRESLDIDTILKNIVESGDFEKVFLKEDGTLGVKKDKSNSTTIPEDIFAPQEFALMEVKNDLCPRCYALKVIHLIDNLENRTLDTIQKLKEREQ